MTDTIAGGAGERFEFGRVFGQTFSLIGRNFALFAMLSLLFVGLPQFAISYLQLVATANGDTEQVGFIVLGGLLVTLVTNYVLIGAITRASVDDLAGKGVAFGAAIGDGLRYFFPLFIVALLVGLGCLLGLLLFIFPAIWLALRWSIAAPIAVIERDGPTHAMGRSAELTKGHRWSVFGLFVIWFIIAYAVLFALALAVAAFTGAALDQQAVGLDAAGIAISVINAIGESLTTLLITVGTAALYFELRRVKEGVGVDALAAVFE